jgi:surface polysaccharide O-acyltransferase-like enzyme
LINADTATTRAEIVCGVIGKTQVCGVSRALTDWIKVIAAIAVVGIHATSASEVRFAQNHNYLSLDFLGVLVNQWARFSVPLFIYLSGYGLTKSDKAEAGGFLTFWGSFLWLRLPTILLPYLCFSAAALAMEFHGYQGPSDGLWNSMARKLLTGVADYHLYFLVILAQCYVLFPLLVSLARRAGTAFRYLTWLSLILVAGLLYKGSSELLLTNLGLAHPGWHASFVIYWLPYFMLGILHAHRPPQLWNSIARTQGAPPIGSPPVAMEFHSHAGLRFSIASAAWLLVGWLVVVAEYVCYSYQNTPPDYYNHFSRPSVMFYALVVVWWLHALPNAASSPPHLDKGKGRGWGQLLAPLTFAVYLIHPQVLRLVTNYLPGLPTLFGWMLVVVTTFVLVYALTLLTNKMHEKGPGFLTGPVRFFQRCLGLR